MQKDSTFEPINEGEPVTLEILAAMVARGFEDVAVRFDRLEKRIDALASDLANWKIEVRSRFDQLETRTFPGYLDREDLEARVAYIEKKLDIKSGK